MLAFLARNSAATAARRLRQTGRMDLSTFYAVVAGTCFTLVGLWWNVVERRPDWLADPHLRRLVGGVYVSFLLPALMSLFAQIDPSEPLIWRITFVIASAVGAWSTPEPDPRRPQGHFPGLIRRHRWLVAVVYGLIAVLGVVPELAGNFGLTPPQAAAFLLVLLVVLAHALTWEFMTADPRGRHRSVADRRGLNGAQSPA